MFFAHEPLWESQTTAMLDLEEALMMQGFEASTMSLNRCISFKTPSIKLGVITP